MGDFFQKWISNIGGQLMLLFQSVKISDVIDILIVTVLIYELILLVRNTRAAQLAKGIAFLLLAFAFASMIGLRTLGYVLSAIMNFGIVVLAVVFQPELRRAIEQVGGTSSAFSWLLGPRRADSTLREAWQGAIVAVCDAAETMAEDRVGALMVLERNTNLIEIIRTGTPLHADVNVETICTIFHEGTPLHDGAMVVRDGKIEAAGCFLPLSNNLEISKEMGTRHRSALGMSENSDAIVVVVSEESGIISLAKNGVLIRRLDRQNLFNLLVSEIVPPEPAKRERRWFKRKAKEGAHEEKE